MTLSLVIPVLNGAVTLPATLACLAEADEVVVVDGGSHDGCPEIAASLGARVLAAPRGRGVQLAAGAAAARGEWLLFLHADTCLAPGWAAEARAFLADPRNRFRAAAFTFALESNAWQARVLEALVALRVRLLALPYGDQGLLISRDHYLRLGGYRPLPLMEDVDLARRIGRRDLARLGSRAVTSASRWEQGGWLRRSGRNLACLALYVLGVSPARLLRLYG